MSDPFPPAYMDLRGAPTDGDCPYCAHPVAGHAEDGTGCPVMVGPPQERCPCWCRRAASVIVALPVVH